MQNQAAPPDSLRFSTKSQGLDFAHWSHGIGVIPPLSLPYTTRLWTVLVHHCRARRHQSLLWSRLNSALNLERKAETSTSFHPFIYKRPTTWFLSSGNTRMLFQSLISWHRREHHAIWTREHHFPATGLRTLEEQKLARSPLPIHEVADEPPHHSLKMYYPTRPKTKGSSQSFVTSTAPPAIPSLSLPLNAQIYF